jgi:hypothetical protein
MSHKSRALIVGELELQLDAQVAKVRRKRKNFEPDPGNIRIGTGNYRYAYLGSCQANWLDAENMEGSEIS